MEEVSLPVGSSKPNGRFKPTEWPTSSRPGTPSSDHALALAPLVRPGWAIKPPRHAHALSLTHSPRFALSPSHQGEAERHCHRELHWARA